jgi:catechol 2,3-dioxygenase-like lactoylglutathione lyase family enzyme
MDGRSYDAGSGGTGTVMINIHAIDHVVFRITDLEKVAAFYTDVLGARWEKKQDEIGLYQLRVGTALIDLVPIDGRLGRIGGAAPATEGRNVDHVCFRVLPWDSEGILAYLQEHGIEAEVVSRYGAEGSGPSIYLSDPEGNVLELKGPPWAQVPPQSNAEKA